MDSGAVQILGVVGLLGVVYMIATSSQPPMSGAASRSSLPAGGALVPLDTPSGATETAKDRRLRRTSTAFAALGAVFTAGSALTAR